MLRKHASIVPLVGVFVTTLATSQVVRIPLDTLTVLDETFFQIELLKPRPARPVVLPDTAGLNERFFTEMAATGGGAQDFVIMVVPGVEGELLYIDRNLNDVLTDDGPPLLFPAGQASLSFEIVSPSEPRQRLKILEARTATYHRLLDPHSDSLLASYTTETGDLVPRLASFVGGMKGDLGFMGKRGSFYFDDRVNFRRGTVSIDGRSYAIGLFDWNFNGLYGDDKDVLIVDRDGKGLLRYSEPLQVFHLNDIFPLAGGHFKIVDLDTYGTWVDIRETTEPLTSFFLSALDSSQAAGATKCDISQSIWDIKGKSFQGDTLALRTFRGQYLLLNFWGEWCRPCLSEIPSLVRAYNRYPRTKIQFVGFANVQNAEKAGKVAADSAMTWPQLLLTDDIGKAFNIKSYPTNILILPNGRECLVGHQISDTFFRMHVH